jgi:hypothetical protein
MVDHHPVQTSAVYLVGAAHRPLVAPPSPPSPLTPSQTEPTTPIEELCLDDDTLSNSYSFAEDNLRSQQRIAGAVHVLNVEAMSLRNLTNLYETDPIVGAGFNSAIEAITRLNDHGQRGKVVLIGVGKSGHICKKLVASFNSLGIHATYLHPTEALHGDLGKIGQYDTVLFITFSGKTPELLLLLPHIGKQLSISYVVTFLDSFGDICHPWSRREGLAESCLGTFGYFLVILNES